VEKLQGFLDNQQRPSLCRLIHIIHSPSDPLLSEWYNFLQKTQLLHSAHYTQVGMFMQ
jgi:hypothetical protein